MDKLISIVIAIALIFSISGCGANKSTAPEPAAQITDIEINVAALSGPTGMGMAYLNEQSDAGNTAYRYNISYASAPDQLTGGLISKEYQIAALPVNLASVLYNKTGGEILTAVVNTLGVLYVVEKGDSVKSLSDLAGKKVIASGQGSTPEYILQYLLAAYGLTDSVNVEFIADNAELITKLGDGSAEIAHLPEPHVTVAMAQNESLRIALKVNDLWSDVCDS
ncbi:MAG: ABC transporter substrate-binding protein, partial [Firmicutes bacterium]|nr:ABC transporter substrate-binding protein [Bacillota bacterium]